MSAEYALTPPEPGTGDRLAARLARLRRPLRAPSRGPRKLTGDTPETILAAILTEIDEIMLPRRVTLRAEGGVPLTLDVMGRRLLGGADLPDLDDPTAFADAAARALRAFVGTARHILLTADRLPGAAPQGARGCSADRLARALGLSPSLTEPQDTGAGLMRVLSADARAWVRLAAPGQALSQGGCPDAAQALIALSRDSGPAFDAMVSAALGGRATQGCLTLSGEDGRDALVLLRQDGRLILARIAGERAAQTTARLHALFDDI